MSIISRSIANIGFGYGQRAVSTVGFFGQQDGRSGVNRLLLMQLQEESLRQDEERKKAKEQPKEPPKKVVKTKPVIKKSEVLLEEPDEVPPFRPLPLPTPLPPERNYLVEAMYITMHIRELVASYKPIKVSVAVQSTAANDEEDIELLLLAS